MTNNLKNIMWIIASLVTVAIVGAADWVTGNEVSFFVFYFVPVSIAAWFIGIEFAIIITLVSALTWFAVDLSLGHVYTAHFIAVWNTTVRLVALTIIGSSVSRIRRLLNREKQLVSELMVSLAEIKLLESFLSVCCECKKIRNDNGEWQPMERYIGERTGTMFSHGYCPECLQKAKLDAGF